MEKDFARKLVKDALQHSFEKERFTYLVKNLLNKIEETPQTVYRGKYIPEAYKEYISTLDRIGKYEDSEGKKLDILIVHLKKTTSLERARTMQRNFIAWYLNGSRGGVLKDAALAAFVAPDEDDWRFSFIKMEYKLSETLKGNLKAKEELTPARRYSFLVGKNENSHTAQSRLVPLLVEDEHNPSLKELEDSFGIEKVTKEFFEKYRQLFLSLKESLDKTVKKDKKIKADFETKGVDTVDFAKKLLGQIVFLYFLQKKGWFGVKRGQPWGKGSKHFLRELFTKRHSDYKNFFNDILEPLFYEALRLERPDDYYSRFDCRIPFLNGGLFDPINDYDWIDTDILLPNDLFSNKQKNKEGDTGTGILDAFDRYNFTVKEDEPLEKEVAVDPEMLGKVFENLLEVKDRKSKGTYYTPREIVHYMCQQSLINYLDTAINTAEKPVVPEKPTQEKFFGPKEAQQKSLVTEQYDCLVPKEDIELFVKYGDSRIENEIIARQKIENIKNGKQKSSNYKLSLPKSIHENAQKIDDALKTIRVCDPAVGSGAFLVGMMHEIVNARTVLSACLEKEKDRTLYDFKRDAIRSCLYGVDIDPGAVEIAKLRLWLSLVVDEEERKTIQPLPNLDYKIVCGNSLLGVQRNLENWQDFAELERLKPLFFNETNARKKQDYKQQIDQIISKVTKGHTEFDFNIYFSEVFHEKKGFDVVIANPPYVSAWAMEKDNAQLRPQIKEVFKGYSILRGHWDLYVAFVARGHQLLTSDGVLGYIVPNPILREKYASETRKFLLTSMTLKSILEFNDVNVFEDVSRRTTVFIAQKSKTNDSYIIPIFSNVDGDFIKQTNRANKEFWMRQPKHTFLIKSTETEELLANKIEEQSCKIGNVFYVNYGAQVSSREKGKFGKKEVVGKHPKGNAKQFYEGKDVQRWHLSYRELWLDYRKGELYGPRVPQLFEQDKICVRKVSDKNHRIAAAFDNTKRYTDDGNILIVPVNTLTETKLRLQYEGYKKINTQLDVKYVLALILSRLESFYFVKRYATESLQGSTSHTYPASVRGLVIKNIPNNEQRPFINIVNNILAITKDGDYLENPAKQTKVKELEKQIDQMVYKLYGLTDEEIAIVEG